MVSWSLTHLMLSHSCRHGSVPPLQHAPGAGEAVAVNPMDGGDMDYADEEHNEDTEDSDVHQVGG